jgi:hypothetical protein
VAVQRIGYRHEITLAAQDQRAAACPGEADRSEGVVDGPQAIAVPPQESLTERA